MLCRSKYRSNSLKAPKSKIKGETQKMTRTFVTYYYSLLSTFQYKQNVNVWYIIQSPYLRGESLQVCGMYYRWLSTCLFNPILG